MREGDPACPLRGEERTASLAHVPSVCRVGTWGSGAHDGGLPGAHLCPVLIGQHVLRPRPAGDTPQIRLPGAYPFLGAAFNITTRCTSVTRTVS